MSILVIFRCLRASNAAKIITGSAPTVPASPAPLTPSILSLVGAGDEITLKKGMLSARGIV